ncbi:MAG TPA: serine/threonine-protein kinase [Candidatus Saccharicenans sp.]|jgi:serine/threonine protein kinase|nr:protein kinase [Candidatus Saccharicenans sp.]HRD01092.1 serine/threonine-protein kinase [Candidatus Saccharicenans sp.]
MFLQGQKVGKYEILRSLGSGGFGSVYLARDTWLDIKVAIKVPHKQSTELYKLLKEPRLQAALNHPNIVRVLAAEKEKDVFFMVMEYVKGQSLEKLLEKEKILDCDRAVDIIKQISYGVEHAHQNKIIHRDLRPSNILISGEGTIKITDFGTSAWLSSVQYASTRIGSPPYMAPEQFMGKASYSSDIYSIGCIFYEMIVGRPPIFDPDPFKILEKAQQGKITPPRLKNMRVSKEVDNLIMRCLAPRVEDRVQTASEIIRELSRLKGKEEKGSELDDIFARIKAREQRKSDLCWNCRRPLPYKTKICPYCGEKV